MSESYLFVLNPISGGTDKSTLTTKIESWGKSSNIRPEIWKTSGDNDLNRLKQKVDSGNYHKIVAVGGDGTLLLCANALRDKDIPLGIIPCGSANGMATELQLPMNIDAAFEVLKNNRTRRVDMLLFNGKYLGLHIGDLGLNANLVKHFSEGDQRGFLGYASGLFSEIFNLQTFDVLIKTEEEDLVRNCYMVAFANAKRYGTGALISHNGLIDDGKFELCILNKLDLTGIAGQFLDLLNDNSEHLEIIQCSKASVKLNQPVSFQIDGELKDDQNEVVVEILPRCLNLIS